MSYKQWADRLEREKRSTYLIYNSYERLYWNNDIGWVDKASADVFTYEETKRLNLPLDGYWVINHG